MAGVSKALEEARVATQFREGNQAALMHGMTPGTSIARLPEEVHVRIPADATLDMLVENLEAMRTGARMILEELGLTSRVDTVEWIGPYQQVVVRITELIARIKGGDFTAGKYGALDAAGVAAARQELAVSLSVGLTKFKHATEWATQWGLLEPLYDKQSGKVEHRLRVYLLKGLSGTLGGSAKIIENWARLLTWEQKRKKGPGIDEVMGKVIGDS